jgi:hypothetical protein
MCLWFQLLLLLWLLLWLWLLFPLMMTEGSVCTVLTVCHVSGTTCRPLSAFFPSFPHPQPTWTIHSLCAVRLGMSLPNWRVGLWPTRYGLPDCCGCCAVLCGVLWWCAVLYGVLMSSAYGVWCFFCVVRRYMLLTKLFGVVSSACCLLISPQSYVSNLFSFSQKFVPFHIYCCLRRPCTVGLCVCSGAVCLHQNNA